MSNPRYGSGKQQFIGQGVDVDLTKLDPAAYEGALAYSENQLYFSDGSIWTIPQDITDIARPRGIPPTNSVEQTQLRLSEFNSPTGETQTGIIFEWNADNIPDFSVGANIETRTITSTIENLYQTLYPEDGFAPGDVIWWRAKYLGTNGTQSQYSTPIAQVYPDIVDNPVAVTRNGAISGTVEISPFTSAFGLQYVNTEFQFWNEGDDPEITPPILEVTSTLGAALALPEALADNGNFLWRARYGANLTGVGTPTVLTEYTAPRVVNKGAGSMVLVYDPALAVNRTINLPLGVYGGIVNVTVDWGDGSENTYTTAGIKTHTYAAGVTGLVTVVISGQLNQYGGNANISGLVRVDNIGFNLGLTSLREMFRNCTLNTTVCTPALPPQVTDCYGMFYQANPGFDVSALDMSNVQNFERMFFYSEYNGPLEWDTSSATSMKEMFYGYQNFTLFNHPSIGDWDVSNVTNFYGMFVRNDIFNQDLSRWNTSSATNMAYMFGTDNSSSRPIFNQPIGSWDVSNVTTAERMFVNNSEFNQDLSNWVFPAGVNIDNMFLGAGSFAGTGGVAGLGINGPSGIQGCFGSCANFSGQGVEQWDVGNCPSFASLFSSCNGLNLDLSGWDTSSVTDVSYMFYSVYNSVVNINWTSCPNLQTMLYMFRRANSMSVIADQLDTSNVSNMQGLFPGTRSFSIDVSGWDTGNVTNMNFTFGGERSVSDTTQTYDVSNWDVRNVTSMLSIFGEDDGETYNPAQKTTDISAWVLNPNVTFGVFTSNPYYDTTFGRRQTNETFGNENYGKMLAGWANTIKTQATPPFSKNIVAGIEQYTATVHFPGAAHETAAEGRAFLTNPRQLTVASASTTDADGDYLWNNITQSYDKANGWYVLRDGSVWTLFDNTDTARAVGTEVVEHPWLTTTWDGVLASGTLEMTGAGWTITDGGLAA